MPFPNVAMGIVSLTRFRLTFGQSSKSTVCPTFTQKKTNPQYLAIEVLRIVYVYWSFLGKCLPNHHHLGILDVDTFLCILHTSAGEVVNDSFHTSVFSFQIVNASGVNTDIFV